MNQESWAQEQLITIRSLMEKATYYRALSSQTALFAGLLTLITSWITYLYFPDNIRYEFGVPGFLTGDILYIFIWLVIFVAVCLFNFFLIYRDNGKDIGKVFSSRMRTAVVDSIPSFIVAIFLSLFFLRQHVITLIPFIWILFYGFALLSTKSYAPKSIVVLGYSFLIFFILILSTYTILMPELLDNLSLNRYQYFSIHMALSFGLLHIIYGVATWQTHRREVALRNAPAIEM